MKNSDYWKSRFEKLESAQIDKGAAYYEELGKQFSDAYMAMQGKIQAWYGRLADNNNLSLQDAKDLLKKNELEEFHWNVNEYIKKGKENAVTQEWVKELENASARAHITRLESIQYDMRQQVELLYGKMDDGLGKTLKNIYEDGYYRTAFEIQKGTGVGTSLARVDSRRLDKAVTESWTNDGRNFSDRIWTNKGKLIGELNTSLAQSIIRGEDPQKAIDSIARKLEVSKRAAGTLVMTESAYQAAACQKDCFSELGVEKYQFVATLDSHTSDICQEMDGQIFDMKDYEVGVTAPPLHCNCRSTTIPYFEDNFGSVGERAARDGDGGKTYYVPADMKFSDWKDKYVDNTRENVIIKAAKDNNIRGVANASPEKKDLSGYAFDAKHANEVREHNVTKEDAQSFVDNALLSVSRFNGKFECYFSSDGAAYLNVKDKTIRTAFKRSQYDERTLEFIKEVENID